MISFLLLIINCQYDLFKIIILFNKVIWFIFLRGIPNWNQNGEEYLGNELRRFEVKSSSTCQTLREGLTEQATLRPKDKCLSH